MAKTKPQIVTKEIIRPGTYTYIHPNTGSPEKLVVDDAFVRHLHDDGNAMLAAGLGVPVPFEHQPNAKPMTAPERAAADLKNNAGWNGKYTIREVDDGDGRKVKALFGDLGIEDAAVAGKLPSTIRYTSPWITSFTDGSGKRWENVVGHIALTTRPRIVKQQPFAHDMAAALSLVEKLTPAKPTDGVELSKAGLMRKDKAGHLAPKFPMAFSLYTGIKLAADMFDEEDDAASDDDEVNINVDTDKEPEPEPKTGEKPPEEAPRESPLDQVGEERDVSLYETIGHLLRVCGLNPPDGMSEETFERDLYETLMARAQEIGMEHAAGKADDETDDEEPEPGLDTGNNPIVQESPSMYASLQEIEQKVKDPQTKKAVVAFFNLSQKTLGEAKKARDQRVERVCKKLPAARRDPFMKRAALPAMALSIGDDGEVRDPFGDILADYEAMVGVVDMTASLTGAKEVTLPDGIMTPARQTELVEQTVRLAGGAAAAKVA